MVKWEGLSWIDLLSPSWEEGFANLCKKQLPNLGLDHFPILLDCGGLHEGWRYFKFENMWLKVDGFVGKISRNVPHMIFWELLVSC